jgi:tetratricopeptide (TPR) repeat protein
MWLLAQIHITNGYYGLAYHPMKVLVDMYPNMPESWNNLGSVHVSTQRLEEAEECFKKALKLKPNFKAALNNLALLSVYDCNWKQAEYFASRSLPQYTDEERANREDWDIRETLSYAQLANGRFGEGWDNYDVMVGKSKCRPLKFLGNEPLWDGKPCKALYMRGEQGIGDEIHFSSILEDASRDNNIILDCDAKLYGLFRRSFPYIRDIYGTRKDSMKPWADGVQADAHCLMGSLSKYYRRTEESFPGKPWLIADPQRRLQWRALLDTYPGLKVGITWMGGLKRTFRNRRSLDLEKMRDWFQLAGITWVSLAYEEEAQEQVDEFRKNDITGTNILHWKRALQTDDYDDTAALVAELDLIISVPTAIVHLAGALGKEVWVMRPEKARWFYYQERKSDGKLVWYPNVQCFPQVRSDWPIKEIAEKLREKLHG